MYPVCTVKDVGSIDVHYAPDKVEVPLRLLIGDRDNEGGSEPMNGCKTVGDEQKALGAPVEYVIYHATHVWDMRELEPGEQNKDDRYVYSAEVTEQSAKDAFAFLDQHMKAP
jgi:dienelactone hydrolase